MILLQKNSVLFASIFVVYTLWGVQLSVFIDKSPEKTGPNSVAKSLFNGLNQLGIFYNVNPGSSSVAHNMIVLSGIENLKKAFGFKQASLIKKLLAGPNICNSPRDHGSLLTNKYIDKCIVPSYWIQVAYEEDAPQLKNRIQCWYAGVNERYWMSRGVKKDRVLIYWKTEPISFCNKVKETLEQYGYTADVIKYGSYNQEQFKALLDRSLFAIWISRSESQGIALAEAWSMNVPTLVWNPEQLIYLGRKYSMVSAAPYLTDSTGRFWKTFEQLHELISNISDNKIEFYPRQWLLDNMSDKKSAERLLDIFKKVL